MIRVLFCRQHWMKYSLKTRKMAIRNLGYEKYNNDYEYMHNILINLPNYSKTTINIEKLTIKIPEGENHAKKLEVDGTLSCKITEVNEKNPNIFLHLLKYFEKCEKVGGIISFSSLYPLTNRLHKLSDNELLELLLTLISVASLHSGVNFPKEDFFVFKNLAKECIKRVKHWNKNQLLLVADICYTLSGPFCTIFHPCVVKILHANPKSLNPYQLTQSFFYVSILRNYNFAKQQTDIEIQILEILHFIDIEELGIIALGFFKTQNKIKNIDLLNKITQEVICQKQIISDFTLNSLLKILQLSFDGSHPVHAALCSQLLKEMKSEIQNKNAFILVRLTTIGNHLNLYENDFINKIMKYLLPCFCNVRLKELDRICFAIMNSRVNFKNSDYFIQSVVKELQRPERIEEIREYFHSFVACIYYLALMGYQSTLISEVLKLSHSLKAQEESRNYMNYAMDRQICELDMMLQIEGLPQYQKFRLSNDYSTSLRKRFSSQIPTKNQTLTSQESSFIELHTILLKMMEEQFLRTAFILPTLSLPEILFCTDGKGNLATFPHEQFDSSEEDIKYALSSDETLIWHALVLVGSSSYIHNTDLLRGSVFAQIRLIEKLGFGVIMVHRRLLRLNAEEKVNQIMKCLDRAINKKWIQKLKSNVNTLN